MVENNSKHTSYRIDVPKEFEDVFSHFYYSENKSNENITKTLLPSFQTILIFSFGTRILFEKKQNLQIILDKYLILGPIKYAFQYSLPANSEILVVNFKNDAFYRLFGRSFVSENLPIHHDELFYNDCFTAMWSELKKENDTNSRVNYILDLCRQHLSQRTSLAEQLSNFKELTSDPIKTIADRHNKTIRTIQMHHKKYFGYSAKEFNRYQRFLRALNLIQKITANGLKVDWFEVIFECGYYDQSHLIRDFKYYFNLSPSQYLKIQQNICNPVT